MMSAAAASGLGTDNCISVPCNEKGQMIPEELERLVHKSISDGKIPFMVTATAGTTVFGAFDPINPIADICEKHHLWLHIDAAWGGGLLMSEKFRYKFEGITRADSVTWNPHKMMNVLLQCSTVHFKQNVSFFYCPFSFGGGNSSRHLFSCRVCCITATGCAPITCSSRTNITTSLTIRETKSSSVVVTMIFSSFGCCGEPR